MPRSAPHFGETVQIGDYRVEALYLTFVAEMLRKHNGRKRLLRDMEDDIIRATPGQNLSDMPKAPGAVGDPTHGAFLRLNDSREPTFGARAHLRGTLRQIEEVFNKLPQDQQEIVKHLYFRKRLALIVVADTLHMTKSTVCRKRNLALLAFARTLIGDHILLPLGER